MLRLRARLVVEGERWDLARSLIGQDATEFWYGQFIGGRGRNKERGEQTERKDWHSAHCSGSHKVLNVQFLQGYEFLVRPCGRIFWQFFNKSELLLPFRGHGLLGGGDTDLTKCREWWQSGAGRRGLPVFRVRDFNLAWYPLWFFFCPRIIHFKKVHPKTFSHAALLMVEDTRIYLVQSCLNLQTNYAGRGLDLTTCQSCFL